MIALFSKVQLQGLCLAIQISFCSLPSLTALADTTDIQPHTSSTQSSNTNAQRPLTDPIPNNVIHAWLFGVMNNDVSKSISAPLFQELGVQLNASFELRVPTNIDQLEELIEAKQIQLIFISETIGKKIISHHQFSAIAQTRQPIQLYAKWRFSANNLHQLHRVGTIMNTKSHDITLNELPALAPNAKITPYANASSAFLALMENELDAIALIPGPKQFLPAKWANKFHIIYQFEEPGVAVVLVSPELATGPTGKAIQAYLLENGASLKGAFQDSIGLGPFELPTQLTGLRP